MSVERFIRFENGEGSVLYGEVSTADLNDNLEGKSVPVLAGNPFTGLSKAGYTSAVKKVSGTNPCESTY